jgi:hypothetical protein
MSDPERGHHIQGRYSIITAVIGVAGIALGVVLTKWLTPCPEHTVTPPIAELPVEMIGIDRLDFDPVPISTEDGEEVLATQYLRDPASFAIRATHVGVDPINLTAVVFVVEEWEKLKIEGPPYRETRFITNLRDVESIDANIYVVNPAPGKRYSAPIKWAELTSSLDDKAPEPTLWEHGSSIILEVDVMGPVDISSPYRVKGYFELIGDTGIKKTDSIVFGF